MNATLTRDADAPEITESFLPDYFWHLDIFERPADLVKGHAQPHKQTVKIQLGVDGQFMAIALEPKGDYWQPMGLVCASFDIYEMLDAARTYERKLAAEGYVNQNSHSNSHLLTSVPQTICDYWSDAEQKWATPSYMVGDDGKTFHKRSRDYKSWWYAEDARKQPEKLLRDAAHSMRKHILGDEFAKERAHREANRINRIMDARSAIITRAIMGGTLTGPTPDLSGHGL